MSSLNEEQKHECEKLFKFLDKDKDKQLTSRELIIGLGVLGKTCTIKEKKKLREEYPTCDLDAFMSLCEQKVKFNEVDAGLVKSFSILESREKPWLYFTKRFYFCFKKIY